MATRNQVGQSHLEVVQRVSQLEQGERKELQKKNIILKMKFTLVLLIVQSSGLKATDCRCGETQNKKKYFDLKVDRGEEAGINEFPWAALLKIRNYSRPGVQYHRCGGTLVNDR